MSDTPQDHPDPDRWWRAIRRQSWLCYIALVLEIPALLYFGVDERASGPLVLVNLGLLSGAVSYGGGSTLIDAIKAWRG
jgi:hypothetical protein